MSQLQTITVNAPGFMGLNTQDSPISMPPQFCSRANNCVIDSFGRIAARKGFSVLSDTGVPAEDIITMGYFEDSLGNEQVYSATSDAIYKGTTALTLAYNTSVTAGDWQMINFNDKMIFVQAAHAPLVASTGGNPALLSQSAAVGTESLTGANVGLGAFGRLWLAQTTASKSKVYWSDLLDPTAFDSGSAGAIDLDDVWPKGQDEVVGLAAHNGFLIIFGKHNIVIYSGPEDPATMVLSDTVAGIGCVHRDTIQTTGNDVIFLSQTGIRGLGRTIQEDSLPNTDLSGNVRDELTRLVRSGQAAGFKSVYSPEEAFYVLYIAEFGLCYVLDMRMMLPETGFARVTKWPGSPFKCFARNWQNGTLYVGGAAGVGEYADYLDAGESYFMNYFTHLMDFGDPVAIKCIKKIRPVIIGAAATIANIKWGFDFKTPLKTEGFQLVESSGSFYNVDEYGEGEYGPNTSVNLLNVNTRGCGTQLQVGVETDISGSKFSIQELTMYATIGKKTW